jgi:hypothetical protein
VNDESAGPQHRTIVASGWLGCLLVGHAPGDRTRGVHLRYNPHEPVERFLATGSVMAVINKDKKKSFTNRRKHSRVALVYGGRLVARDGSFASKCVVVDISAMGARLKIDDPAAVPDEFVLLLSRGGETQRHCTVVWRGEGDMGVRFEKRPADASSDPA